MAPGSAGRKAGAQAVGIGQRGQPRRAVPGADFLANIAAKEPIALRRAQRLGGGAAQLDGGVGQAAAGIELIGRGEGIGGTGVQTGAATAAVVGLLRIVGQRQVGQHHPQKHIGAEAAVQQAGVFANPAQAGLGRQRALQQRPRIHIAAQPHRLRRKQRLNGRFVGPQPVAEHGVIILAAGIAGNAQAGRSALLRLRAVRAARFRAGGVAQGHGNGALRAGQHAARIQALLRPSLNPAHFAGVAPRQPLAQKSVPGAGRGGAEAHGVEAECRAEAAKLIGQRQRAPGHPPIIRSLWQARGGVLYAGAMDADAIAREGAGEERAGAAWQTPTAEVISLSCELSAYAPDDEPLF